MRRSLLDYADFDQDVQLSAEEWARFWVYPREEDIFEEADVVEKVVKVKEEDLSAKSTLEHEQGSEETPTPTEQADETTTCHTLPFASYELSFFLGNFG